MVSQIEWSAKAQRTFDNIIAYLEQEFTEREVVNFISKVNEKLDLLRSFPRLGVPSKRTRNSFRTLVHKKVTLVYHYKPIKKEIVLITFWNNLQDPKRFKY